MKLYEILDRLSGYPEDTEILISDVYGNDCLNFELVHIKVPFGYALKLKPCVAMIAQIQIIGILENKHHGWVTYTWKETW